MVTIWSINKPFETTMVNRPEEGGSPWLIDRTEQQATAVLRRFRHQNQPSSYKVAVKTPRLGGAKRKLSEEFTLNILQYFKALPKQLVQGLTVQAISINNAIAQIFGCCMML